MLDIYTYIALYTCNAYITHNIYSKDAECYYFFHNISGIWSCLNSIAAQKMINSNSFSRCSLWFLS